MTTSPPKKKQARLGAFLPAHGHHVAAWRHPNTPADAGHDFQHYKRLALAAEAAKFDAVFLADIVSVNVPGNKTEALTYSARGGHFEPLTLLSALAAVTERIGLVSTVTTTYNEPYHVARKFASLDHISGGRAGWNLVTSANAAEAWNFGRDHHLEHGRRYERANEFIDVVAGLWDSWEDDAFLRDKASGRYVDPAKVHVLDHQGTQFQVKGPLNVARSPQGYPVRVQAGSSEPGKELAARTAEVVFTAQQTLDEGRAFYSDLKGRLAKYGRGPDELKILPGLFPVVGRTQAEAEAKFQQIQDLIHPTVGLGLLGGMLGGFDLSGYDLDGPLPELPESNGGKSRQALLIEIARRDKLTIRQLYLQIAGARGHKQIVGTPETIADFIEEWLLNDAADGFNIMPPTLPDGLTDFIELVLPELRRRGLFRTEYEGRTLRENLGLSRPVNQFAARAHAKPVTPVAAATAPARQPAAAFSSPYALD
jgi:alkanesulfonate monooxygenase